jgi:hypothetical protein
MRRGQRLDHRFIAIFPGDEPQHTLIHGSRCVELESGIQSVFHVVEVLMRHGFHQAGRHVAPARFRVVGIGQAAARPGRGVEPANIVHDLRLDQIAQIPIDGSGPPVGKRRFAVFAPGIIDHQRPDDAIRDPRVGMKGEHQIDRDAQTGMTRIFIRAIGRAVEIVGPFRPAAEIVGVVRSIVTRVEAHLVGQLGGRSGVLKPIARPFQVAGIAAGLPAPDHIARPPPNLTASAQTTDPGRSE